MPRDGSGTYTLPAGNPVVDGTIIDTAWANPTMSDIAVQLNNVLTRDGVLGPNLPFKFIAGTAAAPGATFAAAPTTGFYWPGAGQLGVTIAGVSAGTFQSTGWNGAVVGNVTGDITGKIVLPLGAVGTPSLSFSGDVNTGIWSAGADIITFSAGGVAALQIGANQLTLANPWVYAPWLGAVDTPSYTFNGDLNTGMYSLGADQIGFATAGIKRLEISAAGNVGINGTPNAYGANTATLSIDAGVVSVVDLNVTGVRQATFNANVGVGAIVFGSITNLPLTFYQNAAEIARIPATGRKEFIVGGTTAPNSSPNRGIIQVDGSTMLFGLSNAGSARGYLYHDNTDLVLLNSVAAGTLSFATNSANRLTISAAGVSSIWDTFTASLIEAGFRDIPGQGIGIARGQCFVTAAGFTVNTQANSNTFSVYNDSGANITLTQGAGLTMRLNGTATTGSRTLLARGFCTIWFRSATECIVSGAVT